MKSQFLSVDSLQGSTFENFITVEGLSIDNLMIPDLSRNQSTLSQLTDREESTERLSTESPNHKKKKCVVCFRGFKIRRKFTCKVCYEYVCGDHSIKKKFKDFQDPSKRVCLKCLNEETEKSVLESLTEFTDKVENLDSQLNGVRASILELYKGKGQNKVLINKLDLEIKGEKRRHEKRKDSLALTLNNEKERKNAMAAIVENLEKAFIDAKNNELNWKNKIETKEQQLIDLNMKLNELNSKKEILSNEISRLDEEIEESKPNNQKIHNLCNKCFDKIMKTLDNLKTQTN